MAGRLERSLNADAGEALLRINWLPGSSSRPGQRCYLHLCDDVHNRSCISVVSFYTRLYVRVYDSNRRLIQVAEADLRATDVNGNPVVPPPAHPMWEEDSWHTVRVQWRAPGELVLTLDGIEADRRVLDRPLGGRFTRLHVGHKPGNWQAKSQIELLALSMETSIQGGEPS